MKFEKQELKVMVDEKNLKGIIEAANKGVEINRESYERLVFDACYMHSNDNGLLLRRLLGKEFNFIREKKGEALPLSNLKWPDIERLLSERLVVVGELRVGDMVSSLFKYDSELSDYMRIAEKFMFSGEIDGACDSITSLLIVIGSIYAAENCPKNCEPSHLNGSSVSDDKEECKKMFDRLQEEFLEYYWKVCKTTDYDGKEYCAFEDNCFADPGEDFMCYYYNKEEAKERAKSWNFCNTTSEANAIRISMALNEDFIDGTLSEARLGHEACDRILTGDEIRDLILHNKSVERNDDKDPAEEDKSSALGSMGLKPKIVH